MTASTPLGTIDSIRYDTNLPVGIGLNLQIAIATPMDCTNTNFVQPSVVTINQIVEKSFALPKGFLLSVVIPIFNEQQTLDAIVRKVLATGIPCELIFVNDGSTDSSHKVIQAWQSMTQCVVISNRVNHGKGAAIRQGFRKAQGDVVVVQDADLEYQPQDLWSLLKPIMEDRADVVYGSRYADQQASAGGWHRRINRTLTQLCNWATGLQLTDMETCYKMIRRETLARILDELREDGFGIEVEMTARLAQVSQTRICEVPIQYQRRTYAQGKKIGWRDGVRALWCIAKYSVMSPQNAQSVAEDFSVAKNAKSAKS